MQRSAIVFLILLRLAVGWHFFYEGIQKVRSHWIGPTVTNRPFTSAGYFREAPGPLGWTWRWVMGDPNQEALAHLEVKPLGEQDDPATDKPHLRMPAALARDWEDYLKRFTDHYQLDDTQKEAAEAKLAQAEAKMVDLLTYVPPSKPDEQATDKKYATYTTEQTRNYPSGEVKRRMGMKERIDEYKAKLGQIEESKRRMRALGKDVEGARLVALKVEVSGLRAGLLKDVDEQTQEMKKSLESVLTKEQKEEDPVQEPKGNFWLEWLDFLTMWGLVVIGTGLMVGLLTRTNAWLGAGFLLLTTIAWPSLPWLPVPPNSEGSYLVVSKNVVELLALCVLATTATGRWFGLDGLIYRTRCWITGRQPN
jgi:uncharacterized membrane protein YphA (DoxX/SURF4 family)